MITQITNVDEFILLQPQLLIDVKNYLLDYLNDQTSDIFQSDYKTLVINYLNSSDSLIDKSAICKKY